MAEPSRAVQMSDARRTLAFLTLSGGFQDAYTYMGRGKVFANAQTGNIVLFGVNLCEGQWAAALRYLVPVLAFAAGVYAAALVRGRANPGGRLHWRQVVLGVEIVLLALVGFLPPALDLPANILVSFACAMQVQAFRKLRGTAYASTMCIGNLRSAMQALYEWRHGEADAGLRAAQYFAMLVLFAAGAALGGLMTLAFGDRVIWGSCALLVVSFALMFRAPAADDAQPG